jgi:hypothetical protein
MSCDEGWALRRYRASARGSKPAGTASCLGVKMLSSRSAQCLAIWLLFLVPMNVELRGQSRDKALADELRQRSEADGVALVNAKARRMELMRFDHGQEFLQNPRGDSTAWLSGNGEFVAWNILNRLAVLDQRPSPVVIDALDGTQLWQLSGCVVGISSMGVSADGRRIAFQAAHTPAGRDVPAESQTGAATDLYYARMAGLYYADSGATTVTLIPGFSRYEPGSSMRGMLPHLVRAISWSPDGSAFAFDYQDRIYIYDVVAKNERSIASGSEPAWSPDGQWIAFRSTDGRVVAMRPRTLESKELLHGRQVEGGIVWSPDSRYVLAFEKASRAWDLFHGFLLDPNPTIKDVVYRLKDGARFAVLSNSDQWVRDYRIFLQGASVPPKFDPCK